MQRLYPLVVFAAAFVLYAPTLAHGFVWDDANWLEGKIRFYSSVLDAWFEPAGLYAYQVYRPLSQTTYLLDQYLWWRNPLGFHLTSVTLHAATSTLVYALARTLGIARPAALVGALLFAVHPVQVESVAWLTSRVDILATAFALLAVCAFIATARHDRWSLVAAVGACAFAAAASKETGCWLPLLLLAARYCLPFPAGRPPLRGVVASVVGVALYLVLRPSGASTGIALASLDLAAALRVVGAFGYQVERLAFPWGFQPYVPEVPGGAAVLASAALGGAVLVGFALRPGAADGPRRFAAVWLLLAMTPAMLLVLADISITPVAEHRLYLPIVGLALLVADALSRSPWVLRSWLGMLGVGLVLAGCASLSLDRSLFWKDDVTLWSAVVARGARDGTPYLNLGLARARSGRRTEAEDAYRKGLEMPGRPATRQRTYTDLGFAVMADGHLDEAADLFAQAIAIGPDGNACYGLGSIARSRAMDAARAGDAERAAREHAHAMELAERALSMSPRDFQAYYLRAGLLLDEKRYAAAREDLERVVQLAGDTALGKDAALGIRDAIKMQAQAGAAKAASP